MKIKHFTLALTALLSFGALASCGNSGDSNVNLTIRLAEETHDLHLDNNGQCTTYMQLGYDFKLGDYKAHDVVFECADSSVKIATGTINDFNPGASTWKATFTKTGTYTITAKVGNNKSKNDIALSIAEGRPIDMKYKLPTATNWKLVTGDADIPEEDTQIYKIGDNFMRMTDANTAIYYEKINAKDYACYDYDSGKWEKREGRTYTYDRIVKILMGTLCPAVDPNDEYKTKTTSEATVKFITSEKTEDRKLPVTVYTTQLTKYSYYSSEDFALCIDYDGMNSFAKEFHYFLKSVDYTVTDFPVKPTK